MHIAILTFDGFNELDSLIAHGLLHRVRRPDWRITLACPTPRVTSMHGVVMDAQATLQDAARADAVIVGSGIHTRDVVADAALMAPLRLLDPSRQLLGAQCSGALILAKLGLLDQVPACTDLTTKPWVQEAGVDVLDQPFFARGNVATAGGCLSATYLAAWFIARLADVGVAQRVLREVAPVGEKESDVERAMGCIGPYLPGASRAAA